MEEAARWFPAGRFLTLPGGERSPAERAELAARSVSDNWDLVILPQSTFGKFPLTAENAVVQLEAEVERYKRWLTSESELSSRTVKEISRSLLRRREELRQKLAASGPVEGPCFEHLGVDYLFVDEAHAYKNLGFTTNLGGVIGSPPDSARARDLAAKIRYLADQRGDPGVVTLATATPFTNRLSEYWVFQSLLVPDLLEDAGCAEHDSWVNTFGGWRSKIEATATGELAVRNRLTEYRNLPEVRRALDQFADIRSAETLALERPNLMGGAPQDVLIAETDEIRAFTAELVGRYEAIRSGDVHPELDNALKICTDARKAALDLRLVGREQPRDGKLARAASEIARIYRTETGMGVDSPGTGCCQLVFADYGVPGGAAEFPLYESLKGLLVEEGIPATAVRYIQAAKTRDQQLALFELCNSGEVAVLIGSTEAMGVGVNVQARLRAVHHLNPPFRASDMQQREGRMLRPGNGFEEVEIFRYLSEGSYDAALYSLCAIKNRFASLLTEGDPDDLARYGEIPDDDVTLSYEAAVALAAGDDRVMRLAELRADLVAEKRSLSGRLRSQENAARQREELAGRAERVDDYRRRLAAAAADWSPADRSVLVVDRLGGELLPVAGASAEEALMRVLATLPDDRSTHRVAKVEGTVIAADRAPALDIRGSDSARIRPAALAKLDGLRTSVSLAASRGSGYQPVRRIRTMLGKLATEIDHVEASRDRIRTELEASVDDYSDLASRRDRVAAKQAVVDELELELAGGDIGDGVAAAASPEVGVGLDL